MLTEEQAKKYIDSGGMICPYCGSGDFRMLDEPEIAKSTAKVSVACNSCRKIWLDTYTLTSVEERNQ